MSEGQVIKSNDFYEDNILVPLIKQLEKADASAKEMNETFKKTGEILKQALGNKGDLNTAKSIREAETAIKAVNIAYKEKIDLEKAAAINQKNLDKAREQEIRLQKSREKSIDDYNKKAAKEVEIQRKLNSEYSQADLKLRQLKLEYRDLSIRKELGIKLTRQEEKEYRLLARGIDKLDGALKRTDTSMGVSTRFVGQYQKALGGVKNMLAQLGLSFGILQGARYLGGLEIKLQSSQLALQNVLKTTDQFNASMRYLTELSRNYGQDLLVLTDTYKNFIASSESSNLTIRERNKIYESIIKSGSSLALTNEQIEGSLLAVSQMFSKGKVSAEELRGQLGERLPGAFGIMAKSMGVTEQQLDKLLKDGDVIAKDVLPKFAEELEKTFGANADKNLKTIGGTWNLLTTNILTYIDEGNDANGITEKIAYGIKFLADNISTIISLLGKAAMAWITYKAVQKAADIAGSIRDWRNLGKAITDTSQATLTASENGKKFGQALKSIGWTVFIDLAIEAGRTIWNFADGTLEATFNLAKFNKGLEGGNKSAGVFISNIEKSHKARRDELETLLKAGKITRKYYDDQIALINKATVSEINARMKVARTRLDEAKEREKIQQQQIKTNNALLNPEREAELVKAIGRSKQEIGFLTGFIKDLRLERDNLSASTKANIDDLGKEIPKVKEVKKEYQDATDQIQRMKDLFNDTQSLEDEIGLYEAQEDINAALESQLDSIAKSGQYNADILKQQIEAEYELQKAIIERTYLEELNSATTVQGRINAQTRRDFELGKLDAKRVKDTKDMLKTLEIAQEDYESEKVAKKKEIDDKAFADELARIQALEKAKQEIIKLSADYFIKQSERKIEQYEKEIERAENTYNTLQQLAINGNITAKESLAAQQRIIDEANRKKIAEQKRIERIKLIETALTTYSGKVEAGDKTPLLSTIKDITLLNEFIKNLPAFYEGTGKGTVADALGSPILPGKDGHMIRVDGQEKILNPSESRMTGKLSGGEIAKVAHMYNNGQLIQPGTDVAGKSWDLPEITKRLDAIERAVINRPQDLIGMEQLAKDLVRLTFETRSNGNTTRNISLIRGKK